MPRFSAHAAGFGLVLSLIAGGWIPKDALATAYVQVSPVQFGMNVYSVTNPTLATITKTAAPFYSATLTADAQRGTLRSLVSGGVGASSGAPTSIWGTGTQNLIYDSVAFQNYQPGDVATLYFSVHGAFADNVPASVDPATVPLHSAGVTYNAQAYSSPTNNYVERIGFTTTATAQSAYCFMVSQCLVGDAPGTIFGTLTIPITDLPYSFQLYMQVTAYGYTADFSGTAQAYLSVPKGVTFTSSGNFLSLAEPIQAVPEPASVALAVMGVGVLLLRRKT